MKMKLHKLDGTARQLDIHVHKDAVDEVYKDVITEIKQTTMVPGFRKGNAPIEIIEKQYKEKAFDEVKRRLLPEVYQQAITEQGMMPVSYPEVFDVQLEPSGEFSFKAKVDVRPEVKLKKYKLIKINANKVSVDDAEVNESLERIRNINAEFTEKDSPIEKGDIGIADIETLIGDTVVSKKHENMWIEADEEASMLGMGKEIVGLKKGDKKDINVTLPENYPDKKYANKAAVFKVEIKDIKEKKLPAIDDDLAKKAGKDTIPELSNEMRDQIYKRKEFNEKINMKNQVMEYLLKNHSFDVPHSMVRRQLKVLVEKAEDNLLKKGMPEASVREHHDKLEEQLLPDAENKVKLYFILESIVESENIVVSPEEIDQWLQTLAESYNKSFEEVKNYYHEHDLVGGIEEQIKEDKTLDFLLSEASIETK